MPGSDAERWVYTVAEAGRMLGLGRNAAYRAVKRGEIPALQIGRKLVVPRIALEALLKGAGRATELERLTGEPAMGGNGAVRGHRRQEVPLR